MSDTLVNRLLAAGVGSCSCDTKTPVLHHHDPECRYRLFTEAAQCIADLIEQVGEKSCERKEP